MSIDNSDQPTGPEAEPTKTPRSRATQTMKPFTAAKKLGVHLPATPREFQETLLTREEFAALSADPPEWLQDLRRTGPHPRPEVARKLGVTISGLARGGVEEALTTDEIHTLLEEMPSWLSQERFNLAQVRDEEIRVKEQNAAKAARREAEGQ